jgi:hypothetical protein
MSTTTSPSRRAVLAGIAAAPALAASTLTLAGATVARHEASLAAADPIFAVIEHHRAVHAAYLATLEAQGNLECRLVDERLAQAGRPEKCSDRWHEAIRAANRDPRYVHAVTASGESSDAETDAAWSLVEEPPTTVTGAAALAAYALGYKLSDVPWPEDAEGSSDDFAAALMRSLYSTLSAAVVS